MHSDHLLGHRRLVCRVALRVIKKVGFKSAAEGGKKLERFGIEFGSEIWYNIGRYGSTRETVE